MREFPPRTWTAEVVRAGRWTWRVHVTDGWGTSIEDPMYGPPLVFGQRRADRKAQRMVAKANEQSERYRIERLHLSDGQEAPDA